MALWIVLVIVVALVAIWWIVTYNSLVALVNNVKNAFSSIDAALQNRYDLIPNLVAVVQQYAKHESETLSKVTELRSSAINSAPASSERFQLENTLAGSLKSVFALSEGYPDLKANENFIQLQNSWFSMEEEIAASRRSYNAGVTDLDNKKQMFPSSIVAGTMRIEPYPFFQANEEARTAPSAKALFSA